ncbi:GFA family protein [uncultured Hoeflea sp.]|uniref:GFA family protein n=1 Tax=uncultured Hoeflea sp. TaxID=538666 RepID=UPI0030DDAA14
MMARKATCSCGQLQTACEGDPVKVAQCHCLACQKRTGAPYGIAAFFDKEAVSISGDSLAYSRPSDSGFPIEFHFCGNCGSTVYWYPARLPDRVAIAVGAFADPDFPPPTLSVFEDTKHSWVRVPDQE